MSDEAVPASGEPVVTRLLQIAGPFDDEMARVCRMAARVIGQLELRVERESELADRLATALSELEALDHGRRAVLSSALHEYEANRAR